MNNPQRAIFFFDGDCGFCNATVLFLLDITKPSSLLFSSLQSEFTQGFFAENGFTQPDLTSAYLFHKGRLYQKSSAVIRAIALSEGLVKYLSICLIIPLFIRDGIYDLFAMNRKRIPIRKDVCRILTPQENQRFLTS